MLESRDILDAGPVPYAERPDPPQCLQVDTEHHRRSALAAAGLIPTETEAEPMLSVVPCGNATVWRKRNAFAPLEFKTLSASLQREWIEHTLTYF